MEPNVLFDELIELSHWEGAMMSLQTSNFLAGSILLEVFKGNFYHLGWFQQILTLLLKTNKLKSW